MKIALITPNNLWVSPYVQIYTKLLVNKGVDYDVISWNRDGKIEKCIQYNYQLKSRNPLKLLWAYYRYSVFIKRIVLSYGYDRLIIFTPQVAIFLNRFLSKHYRNRYIFDYRDLSIEQKPIFKKAFVKVLKNSFANVISSPGFKKFLPSEFNFIISHNFNIDMALNAKSLKMSSIERQPITVLTIGAIRLDKNIDVIDSLGDKEGIYMEFVGKGPDSKILEKYVKRKRYSNITFKGFYRKEEEADIIQKSTIINIFYPQIPSHISALSNRFYNSLIYKRPMIVTKDSTQGDYAMNYNVGLVIEECDYLPQKIKEYISSLDYKAYCNNCNQLLSVFIEDYRIWSDMVIKFVAS